MLKPIIENNHVSILLVEDEKIIALDIRKKLEQNGYNVVKTAASGKEALDSIVETKPDLVIMDVRLEGPMDGIQTASIVQKDYNLPVVMITGYSDDNTIQRVQKSSAFGFLLKPFESHELNTVVQIALQRHRTELALVEKEIRGRLFVELAAQAIFVTDHLGRIIKLNTMAVELTGYSKSELIGLNVSNIFSPEPEFLNLMPGNSGFRISSGIQEIDLIRNDGSKVPIEVSYSRQPGDLLQIFIHDLRLRDETTEKLRLTARVFENIVEGVFITDARRRIVTINKSFSAITGYSQADLVDQGLQIFKSNQHSRPFYVKLWRELERNGKWEGEVHLKKKNLDDSSEWASLSVIRDSRGNITHFVGIFIDLSERKRYEQKLYHLAHHDPLTSLPNRNLYVERLQRCLLRSQRSESQFALLFIDLDKFKSINDNLGHDAGDRVLVQIAERISQCLRKNDTVSRFGGDEFNVLIEDIRDPEDAAIVAKKIISSLSRPFRIEGTTHFVTPSIGISVFPEDGTNGDTLFQKADKAMYRAKLDGGNQYNFASTDNEIKSLERKLLFSGIERGLAEHQFRINFQPVLKIQNEKVNHFKAALYWDHPSIGALQTERFQRLILENSLSLFFAIHSIEEVYVQMKGWQESGFEPGAIEIDIPSVVLERNAFFEAIDSLYTRHRSLFGKLILCVEEKDLRRVMDHKQEFIEQILGRKIMLSIKNPGSGFLSIHDMRTLPLHNFRSNCSFVRDSHEVDLSIPRIISGMAYGLGIHSIAEGIGKEEQIYLVRDSGFNLYENSNQKPLNGREVLAQFG